MKFFGSYTVNRKKKKVDCIDNACMYATDEYRHLQMPKKPYKQQGASSSNELTMIIDANRGPQPKVPDSFLVEVALVRVNSELSSDDENELLSDDENEIQREDEDVFNQLELAGLTF